jgi:hypothetical protein
VIPEDYASSPASCIAPAAASTRQARQDAAVSARLRTPLKANPKVSAASEPPQGYTKERYLQEELRKVRDDLSRPQTIDNFTGGRGLGWANTKGKDFEEKVGGVLEVLQRRFPEAVRLEVQPTMTLDNGDIVIPDFHLTVGFLHERRHYLIECRDRERDTKDIVHKIRFVRSKQRWQSSMFIYPSEISSGLALALDREGIVHLNFEGLCLWSSRLSVELDVTANLPADRYPSVDLRGSTPDAAMISR